MNLTNEQINIIETVSDPKVNLLKIEAVAGAGKTSTLVSVAEHLKPQKALYTAFNKAIVVEASLSFKYPVVCKTLHAVAWSFVIPGTGRVIDDFTYTCIQEDITPEEKKTVKDAMDDFFQSSDIALSYIDKKYGKEIGDICKIYINKMQQGLIPVTFGFILKYFHLLLTNKENVDKIIPYDILMLDEAGDVTGVTLEIFKLLPAKKKLMVGDTHQNIYTFMGTVNGFEELYNEGVSCYLTQSFRVSEDIAVKVQNFMHKRINPNIIFTGTVFPPKPKIKTLAYLARTNAGVINRIIALNSTGTKYNLLRDPAEIFALPLALLALREDRLPFKKEHHYLRTELIKFNKSKTLQTRFKTFRRYLADAYSFDTRVVQAVRLLTKYSYKMIMDTYNEAKQMPKGEHDITIASIHTSKGLTFDSSYIENDMNKLISAITDGKMEIDEESALAEYNLAYVACTRAKYKLYNAKFLEDDYKYEDTLDVLDIDDLYTTSNNIHSL